jgi:hypothetical protein
MLLLPELCIHDKWFRELGCRYGWNYHALHNARRLIHDICGQLSKSSFYEFSYSAHRIFR